MVEDRVKLGQGLSTGAKELNELSNESHGSKAWLQLAMASTIRGC